MEILGYPNGAISALADRLADCPIRLRWGGDQAPNAINGGVHLLNGLEQLKAFVAAGVPTVPFTDAPTVRDAWMKQGYVVLGRKLHHTQGFDIVVPGTLRANHRWRNRDYWTIYQEGVQRELRIHILKGPDGKLLSIGRGAKTHPSPPTRSESLDPRTGAYRFQPIIRSRRLGWTITHAKDQAAINDAARNIAKQAVAACKYELGAVDMLDMGGNQYKVLEVNSRPAIRDEYTISAYADALRRLANAPTAG